MTEIRWSRDVSKQLRLQLEVADRRDGGARGDIGCPSVSRYLVKNSTRSRLRNLRVADDFTRESQALAAYIAPFGFELGGKPGMIGGRHGITGQLNDPALVEGAVVDRKQCQGVSRIAFCAISHQS